ncbi:hypothetical protein OEZ85_002354 [Tetradesmus obliquus]|uniref:Deoxynucleoside kinase domain-containing protein n=1 Tax=Tetradesmus obliquus TaxID=3088 RepID=A0ABY8U5K8_TETOB|nr:hypothetical protein OEZ85_002354 [Tetradesmus obliquus]
MVTVVSVESPPGGGKGFLLKYLASKGMRVALQDDAICHIMDLNTDARRWAFFTELFFLDMHVKCFKDASNSSGGGGVLLLEGSPLTDRLCYYEALHKRSMHPLEAELYEQWYEILRPQWRVDHSLLLLADTHAHVERIIDNAKVEQAALGIDQLHAMLNTYVAALPEVVIQTPKMLAPFGVAELSQAGDTRKPWLSLALQVPADSEFRQWYVSLENHVRQVASTRSEEWFGQVAASPNLEEAFCSCMRESLDGCHGLLLNLTVPVRRGECMTAFFLKDGTPATREAVTRQQEVACQLQLEGLWFKNGRWGISWELKAVKCYGAVAQSAEEVGGFGFVSDDEDGY